MDGALSRYGEGRAGGKELSFGEKIVDTIQLPGKAPSLSENTG